MSGRAKLVLAALLALPAGFSGVFALQHRIDAERQTARQEKDDLLLRSGRLVRALSLGYDTFAAEVYWTRVVQYYGEKHHRHDANLELLAPLLDLTTTLDPHLVVAYKFGGIFLAEPPPRGAGRPDLAVQLLRRGIENNPEQWRLWADLGFIYYWELKDYAKASEAFLEGSKDPKAGTWMKVLAAEVAEEGRSRNVSAFLWKQVYESTQDPNIRTNALEHLQSLQAEEDAEHLEEIAAQYKRRFGRRPGRIAELVSAGMLRAEPVDPAGVPYVVDGEGKVRLSPNSPIRSDVLRPMPKP